MSCARAEIIFMSEAPSETFIEVTFVLTLEEKLISAVNSQSLVHELCGGDSMSTWYFWEKVVG